MTEIVKKVGGRVCLYRKKAGMSQEKLGELAGLHNTYISQIERAEKNVSIEAIDKIINALGLSYEEFYGKINGDNSGKNEIASACYDMIMLMDDKRQRLVYEMIKEMGGN